MMRERFIVVTEELFIKLHQRTLKQHTLRGKQ